MGMKLSELSEVSLLNLGDTANFYVVTASGSKRMSFDNLSKSINKSGAYPFNDAVELDYSWADIDAMCTDGDFQDIRVGDYKTISLTTGETVICEVAGIDTEYNTGDTGYVVGHHIDFISRDCLSSTVAWNTTANNNGTSSENCPYMNSNVRSHLINTVLPTVPTDLSGVIDDKRALIASRYSSSGTITSSTTWAWRSLGKLWLPSETEVYGQVVWGENWSTGNSSQYPIFRDGWAKRVKGAGNGGSRCPWWLRCVHGENSTSACTVGYYGAPDHLTATRLLRVPLCFRIAA